MNHRKLTYDCAAPPSTEFDIAIGPMASAAGAPRICSMRTIKSDVVVGLGPEGDKLADKLENEEPGWKISGKYVSASSELADIKTNPVHAGCCVALRRSPWREGSLRLRRRLGHGAYCIETNKTDFDET